jgi:cobalt-precorrin-5B (C1)-methyltransferase
VKKKDLRSGYTTGACAAAAAKAAVIALMGLESGRGEVTSPLRSPENIHEVEIPFPDGSRHSFKIQNSKSKTEKDELIASSSVIKDAGDDPDVTHRAEIVAEARLVQGTDAGARLPLRIDIKGGKGVGTVTKPGLPVPVGEAAINPVPRKMIEDAVMEAVDIGKGKARLAPTIEITISVPNGEELARKTLNHRLGIVGGISILGTTGIVKPVSAEAWTATISSSMDVAKAMGHKEIVVSAGRSSEKAHVKKFKLPEEAYVLMGDYLEYSLKEAGRHGFKKIHLCAQWAKMVKIAMATPQTHVRFGAINIKKAVEFLDGLGVGAYGNTRLPDLEFNTAREIFDYILSSRNAKARRAVPLQKVCNAAKNYAEAVAGRIPVTAYLVSYEGEIIAASE